MFCRLREVTLAIVLIFILAILALNTAASGIYSLTLNQGQVFTFNWNKTSLQLKAMGNNYSVIEQQQWEKYKQWLSQQWTQFMYSSYQLSSNLQSAFEGPAKQLLAWLRSYEITGQQYWWEMQYIFQTAFNDLALPSVSFNKDDLIQDVVWKIGKLVDWLRQQLIPKNIISTF